MKVFLKPWWKNYLPWNWKSRKVTQEIIDYQEKMVGDDIRKLTIKCQFAGRLATDKEIEKIAKKLITKEKQ